MDRVAVVVRTLLVFFVAFSAARLLVGNHRGSESPIPNNPLLGPGPVPLAVVHDEEAGPIPVTRLLNPEKPAVLVVLNVSCTSCESYLPVLDGMVERYAGDARFVLLVCAVDFEETRRVAGGSRAFRES
jgi:thiol-disulfide isomerase/thioredoxin